MLFFQATIDNFRYKCHICYQNTESFNDLITSITFNKPVSSSAIILLNKTYFTTCQKFVCVQLVRRTFACVLDCEVYALLLSQVLQLVKATRVVMRYVLH